MASDNPELDVQKQQFNQLQDQFNKVADQSPPSQYQYIKLPDGQYGKFRNNTSDAEIRAQIEKDYPGAFSVQPQRTGEQPGAPSMQPPQTPTTPGEQLPTPLAAGGQTLTEQQSQGWGLSGIMSKINAPFAAAGDVVGAGVQKGMAGLGFDPAGIPAAAAATAANLFTQSVTGGVVTKALEGIPAAANALKNFKLYKSQEDLIGELLHKHLGGPETMVGRLAKPYQEAATAAYNTAKSVGEMSNVPPAQAIKTALQSVKNKLVPSQTAEKFLDGVLKRIAGKPTATGEEYQAMTADLRLAAKGFAAGERPDYVASQRIYQARENVLNQLDNLGAETRKGNQIIRQGNLVEDIHDALLRPHPEQKIYSMLYGNPRTTKELGLTNEKDIKDFLAMAERIGRAPEKSKIASIANELAGKGLVRYAMHRYLFDFFFASHGR